MTMKELRDARLPLIVHLEQAGRDTGRFVVVAEFTKHDVVIFQGGTATLEPISTDAFRREWSGYAIAPQNNIGGRFPPSRKIAALVVVWAVVSVGRKVIRRRTIG
jgi:ABC-type bacteriocin/lantibiotic exporter with double-glycine peptidase domain